MPAKTAKTPPIRRQFPFSQFKMLNEDTGTFSGYLAAYSDEDQGGDIIDAGASAKTLTEAKALQTKRLSQGAPSGRYLWPIFGGHDDKNAIGGFTTAREDVKGLFIEAELDMDIEEGRRAYSGMKKGYAAGLSIGYFATKYHYDQKGRRHLTEIAIFEGSITPIPMNLDAIVTEVKDATANAENNDAIDTPPNADKKGQRMPTDCQDARHRKARDFDTLFQSLNAADDLQDEWGDTFIAFTQAMSELMGQAVAQANGWLPESMPTIDATEAAQANLDAFGKAVMSLVQRSIAASFAPCLDNDGDQFLDPDGCNADEDDCDTYYMSRDTSDAEGKAGRTMSAANHSELGDIVSNVGKAAKTLTASHKALQAYHAKMAPNSTAKPGADGSQDGNSDTTSSDDAGDSSKKAIQPAGEPEAGRHGDTSDDTTSQGEPLTKDDVRSLIRQRLDAQRLAARVETAQASA